MANAATNYMGMDALNKSDQNLSGIKEKFNNDQLAEAARIQGLPADQQINQGLLSKFPLAQQQAQALRKQQMDLREKVISAAGAAGNSDMIAHMAGGGNLGDYRQAAQKAPEFGQDAQGNSYVKVYDKNGAMTVHYAPQGIKFNMPGQEATTALGILKEDLTTRQKAADAAKSTLASNSFVLDALQQGAQAGGGEAYKQALRKGLQAFGINSPDTQSTEQLIMATGAAVLANAEKLRPASDTDVKNLREMVGSVGSDPTALARAVAFANALSLKTLHGYNQYVDTQKTNLKTPYAQDLFSGAGIGYEMPNQLSGPMGSQLETVRHYQNIGGDPSIFKIGGETVAPGTKFNVDPLRGMPGVQGKGAAPAPGAKLTPEQRVARLRALEAWQNADPATRGPAP
jgi:hypothetical protein